MKKLLKILTFAIVMVIINPISVKAATYYTNEGVTGGFIPYNTRTKVISSIYFDKTTNTKKESVGVFDNTKSKKNATMTVSFSKSKTRGYTFSVSKDVPIKCLKDDVKATIGGKIDFSETISISGSKVIPPKKKGTAYFYYEKRVVKYKYVCQYQQKNIHGKWCNKGKTFTKYATVTTKVPAITITVK